VAISDDKGVLVEKLAYDAWGKRRTLTGAPINGTATPDNIDGVVDNRGFTGHEMLDNLDLVHMNGRIYDPLLGKFLSADPLVQDPINGQSYNRYSYVLNNPTNLTDPTGFSPCTGSRLGDACDAGRVAAGYLTEPGTNKQDKTPTAATTEFVNRIMGPAGFAKVPAKQGGNETQNVPSDGGGQSFGIRRAVLDSVSDRVAELGSTPVAKTIGTVVHVGASMIPDSVFEVGVTAILGAVASKVAPFMRSLFGAGAGAESLAAKSIASESRSLTTYQPANNGTLGESAPFTLLPGTRVDRLGRDAGRYLSPEGTPSAMRALSPTDAPRAYSVFEVKIPFTVQAGTTAPAFSQPGLGLQFYTDRAISDLLRGGYLTRVGP